MTLALQATRFGAASSSGFRPLAPAVNPLTSSVDETFLHTNLPDASSARCI